MSRRVNPYQPRKWIEDCWARIFPCFRECDLQRKQSMQESQKEKDEMRQQQRMKVMTEWTHITVGGSVSCWPLTAKKRDWEDTIL